MDLIFKILTIFFCLMICISCDKKNYIEKMDDDFNYVDNENLNDNDDNESDMDYITESADNIIDEENEDVFKVDEVIENDQSNDESTDESIDEIPDYDDAEGNIFVKVSVNSNPVISLTAIVEVKTAREAQVFIRFNKPFQESSETSITAKGLDHRIIVAGMTAESFYEFEVVAVENGIENIFETSFTTGALPEKMPEFEFEVLQPEKITKGITFFPTNTTDPENPQFIGIDENFDVVWYLPADFFHQ